MLEDESVMINDYRGRNPADNLDAMIHIPSCISIPNPLPPWWSEFPTLADAQAAFERARTFVCPLCLPGRGPHLTR